MAKTPDEVVQRRLRQGNDALEDQVATDLGAKLRHVRRHPALNPLIFPVYELPQVRPEQVLDLSGYHRIHGIARETNVKVEAKSDDGRINIVFDVTKPYAESPGAEEVAKRTALSLEKLSGALGSDLARLAELPAMNPLVYPINDQERASVEDVKQGKAYQRLDAIAKENNVKIEIKKRRGRAVAIIVDATRTYDDRMDKHFAAAAKPLSLEEQADNLKDDITRTRRHPQLNPFTFAVNAQEKVSHEQIIQDAAYRRMHETAQALNVKIEANKKFRRGITSITVDVSRPYLESPDAEAVQKIRDAEKAAERARHRAEHANDYQEALEAIAAEAAARAEEQKRGAEAQEKLDLQQTDLQLQLAFRDQLPARLAADRVEGKEYLHIPIEGATPADIKGFRAYQDLHALAAEQNMRVDLQFNPGGGQIILFLEQPYSATPEDIIPAPVARETLAAEKDINLRQFAKQNLPDVIKGAIAQGLNGSFTIDVPEMTAAELRKSEGYKAVHHAGSKLDKRIEMGTHEGITTIFVSTNEPYAASTHAGKFTFPTYEEERAAKDAELQNFAKNQLPGIIIAAEQQQGAVTIPVREMTLAELGASQAYKDLHQTSAAADKRIEMSDQEGVATLTVISTEPYSASTHANKFGFTAPEQPKGPGHAELLAQEDKDLQAFVKNQLFDAIIQMRLGQHKDKLGIEVQHAGAAELAEMQAYKDLHKLCAKINKRVGIHVEDGAVTIVIKLTEPYSASADADKYGFLQAAAKPAAAALPRLHP